jgi:hypothetical protein
MRTTVTFSCELNIGIGETTWLPRGVWNKREIVKQRVSQTFSRFVYLSALETTAHHGSLAPQAMPTQTPGGCRLDSIYNWIGGVLPAVKILPLQHRCDFRVLPSPSLT